MPRPVLPCVFGVLFVLAVTPLHAEKIVLVAGTGAAEKDAPATQCALHEPFCTEFTPSGEMIIAEMEHGNRVLKVGKDGILHVLAGTGAKGASGDGGPASAATFNGIHNFIVRHDGDLLLADTFNSLLRRIDARTQIITTLAGSAGKGFAGDGGPMKDAQFATLIQIAVNPNGTRLYCADIGNHRIRRIDLATGVITTVAGNGQSGVPADGADAVNASLSDPRAVTPDAQGGFYILERNGNALRYVDAAGKIKTVVGTGKKGLSGDGGPSLQATMTGPKYTALDRDGTVLVADAENNVIRRYDPKAGLITRVAGTGKPGAAGLDGDPLQCQLRRPHGVTVGPDGSLYITDSYNDRILKIAR
jgi:DNA-binding beta-propeller fold protein YncE